MDGGADVWTEGRSSEQKDGQPEGQTDGRSNSRKEGETVEKELFVSIFKFLEYKQSRESVSRHLAKITSSLFLCQISNVNNRAA